MVVVCSLDEFLRAARYGWRDYVSAALSASVVNGTDGEERSALHLAASTGCDEVVRVLLLGGADVTARNKDGRTALWAACFRGQTEVLALLLRHGADVDVQDKNGRTLLYEASARGHVQVVSRLLEFGADVNVPSKKGITALWEASVRGHAEVVSLLLQHGADTSVQDEDGRTSLLAATGAGHAQVVSLLLQHGACVNTPDKEGVTPLWLASRLGHSDIAVLLLEHGGDCHIANDSGLLPIQVALEYGHAEVVNVLALFGYSHTDRGAEDGSSEDDEGRNCWRCALHSSQSSTDSDETVLYQTDIDLTHSNMDSDQTQTGQPSPLPPPVMSQCWEISGQFTEEGGCLRKPASDVMLIVPPGAVKTGTTVTISSAVCVDMELLFSRLALPEDSVTILSPFAEYWVDGNIQFQKPVTIMLPHFLSSSLDPETLQVYRVQRDEDSPSLKLREVYRETILEDSQEHNDPWCVYNGDSETVQVITNHFSGFVCIYCNKSKSQPKLPLELFIRGKGTLRDQNDRQQVHVNTYLWDGRIRIQDFMMDPDIRGLSDSIPVLLSNVLTYSTLHLKLHLAAGLEHLQHSRCLAGSLLYPEETEFNLCTWIGCRKCFRKKRFERKDFQWHLEFPPDYRTVDSLVLYVRATHRKQPSPLVETSTLHVGIAKDFTVRRLGSVSSANESEQWENLSLANYSSYSNQ